MYSGLHFWGIRHDPNWSGHSMEGTRLQESPSQGTGKFSAELPEAARR